MKRAIIFTLACLFAGALHANHWTPVDEGMYAWSMTIYGIIQINGVEQYSDQWELGVFCGDECRGSAIASEFFLTHRYLVEVNVYGDSGNQLTFKLYDHSNNVELDLTSPEALSFSIDGYGTPVAPYVFDYTGELPDPTFNVTLTAGWNCWSTYLDITLEDLKAALGTDASITSQDDGFATYVDGIGWVGSLSSIDPAKMYKIKTSSGVNVTISGTEVDPSLLLITLKKGSNWIGFPLSQSMSITEAFAGANPINGDKVSCFGQYAEYLNGTWTGDLQTLEPGKGYIYNSAAESDRTLVFPTGAKASK